MTDYANVAKEFTQFYYNTFDKDRTSLQALYREESMLTFEASSIQGKAGIMEKLTNLPFTKIQHQVSTLDSQPSLSDGGVLCLVTGILLVDEEQRTMSYSQVFTLRPDGKGSYFILNDVFRLVYA